MINGIYRLSRWTALIGGLMLVALVLAAGMVPRVLDLALRRPDIEAAKLAALLLAGVATATPALADVALTLAVLAAFASVAMARTAPSADKQGEDRG